LSFITDFYFPDMDVLLFGLSLLAGLALFFIPGSVKFWLSAALHLGLAIPTTTWAIEALWLSSKPQHGFLALFWVGHWNLTIDALSAFFILLINLTSLGALLYSKGYLAYYHKVKTHFHMSLHRWSLVMLHGAMLLVVMSDGYYFLLSWELMSLTSFVLVIFEGDKREVMKTGVNYLVQMHLGFMALVLAFFYTSSNWEGMGFAALGQAFAQGANWPLFLPFFLGFGIKVGWMPLHSWLPHAHPAAPSHVSGLMSGVMIKMGVYGLMRVIFQLQNDYLYVGLLLLVVGMVSALMGILLAVFQRDVKKLLAYSSIENMGIVGMALGLGILGKALNSLVLLFMGFSAAFLHLINHSLFKSLLFFMTGNIYKATHTKDMEDLGGLIKKMPYTAAFFLMGALAISGLPPLNGFASEFLLYHATFLNLSQAGFGMSFLSLAVILVLALMGGLSIYAFTKIFGITFLGLPRSKAVAHAQEVSPSMLIAPLWIVLFMLLIGFFPGLFLTQIHGILQQYSFFQYDQALYERVLANFNQLGYLDLCFMALVALVALLRYWQQRRVVVEQGPTWGCGYTGADAKHQYTSSSYANALLPLFGAFVRHYRSKVRYSDEEIFPKERSFETQTEDAIEEGWLKRPVAALLDWLPRLGVAQSGYIQTYLLYPLLFVVLIFFLTYFQWL
jgi:formate hydrogenlyase subunit 3/multisubunit Na+/H+ antiporter MnhD subunit